jgi:hypothetical protein
MAPMRAGAAVLALSALAWASSARAQEPPDRIEIARALEIAGTDECLSAETLATEVARWLGRSEIDRRIGVIVRPATEGGDTLEVVRDGAVIAERSADAGDATCGERRAALALMIALAIDATVLTELHEPDPPQVEPVAPAPQRIEIGLGIEVLFVWGLLPEVAGGAALSFDLRPIDWLALRAAALFALTVDVPLAGGNVSSAFIGGRVDVCPGASVPPFRLEACAALVAGAVRAAGTDFSVNQETVLPWAAVGLGAAARVEFSREIALRLSVESAIPFVRPEIAVIGGDGATIATAPSSPVAVDAALGVVFLFP